VPLVNAAISHLHEAIRFTEPLLGDLTMDCSMVILFSTFDGWVLHPMVFEAHG
jgi:hypothetical protein